MMVGATQIRYEKVVTKIMAQFTHINYEKIVIGKIHNDPTFANIIVGKTGSIYG